MTTTFIGGGNMATALIGGMLDIESAEGQGTRVCAWVPLEKQG